MRHSSLRSTPNGRPAPARRKSTRLSRRLQWAAAIPLTLAVAAALTGLVLVYLGLEPVIVKKQPAVTVTAEVATPVAPALQSATPAVTSLAPPTVVAATPMPPVQYQVQAGDSLSAIAMFFGVTPDDLIALNKLPRDGRMAVGQILLIPRGP
jgi:hypothetical protein